MTFLEPLMRQNFLEYASYVVVDRAIPDIRDGCKPVQRRILHTLFNMDDGKFMKVANVIGEAMKLHPHGDASIGDALVVLANKEFFLDRQGNFGNVLTGDNAAAARYIECRLTPLAKETLFNEPLTRFLPSYDGRNKEPEALPVKVPVILMMGTEGIAVGMATTILPHNFIELLQAQVHILKEERFKCLPDFVQGGLMDASEYADGKGKVKLRARIERAGDKKVIIREIPFGTTVDSIMASIEAAVAKGKVKISEISDRTGSEVEIELSLARGSYADEVIPQLYAYTDCEVSVNSNIVLIRDRKPAEMSVSEILRYLTEQLKDTIKRELEYELGQLEEKQHALTLEQVFIENRVYKKIETATTEEEVVSKVYGGMKPFAEAFVRPMNDADVARLLEIRIKRISQFDINKNRKDIEEVIASIKKARNKLKNLVPTTIGWLEGLIKKYGPSYPRRTKVTTFTAVDKKAVALANVKVGYDSSTGFFGTSVRGGEKEFKITEYDKILIITQDGMYKVVGPVEKMLVEGKVVHMDVFDEEKGFTLTVVYRDKDGVPWAKRSTITSFIKDKEYELIKDRQGKVDYLATDLLGEVVMSFMTRGRTTESRFELEALEPCGLTARGTKLSDNKASKVTVVRPPEPEPPKA
ncbi:MAG: DNA topoisomerase IV subunit A [Deltaproteobacteria bacterium]|nr:DNA topoisomerase IV subunit A [Deltaproteobacteria bacterium]